MLKTECKATPSEMSQERVARAEEVTKEDKLHHSILPRLEGAVLKTAWVWNGSGMRQQHFSTDL